jgi:pimeloyl-ACP methyl ester carboxylesterase
LALLDTLGLERVVLLAYSLGGEAAAAFAAAYPDRVSHLALVAPIGPRPHRARRNPVVRIYGSLLRFWPMTPLLRASTSAALRIGGFPKRLKFDEVRETLRALMSVDFAAHGERLASLEIPTLLAWCDDDRWIEPELFRDMAALCPPGPRLHFETGGHALQKTRSEEISNAMLEWLDKEE